MYYSANASVCLLLLILLPPTFHRSLGAAVRSVHVSRRDAGSRANASSDSKYGQYSQETCQNLRRGAAAPCDSPNLNYLAFFPCTCAKQSISECSVALLRQCDVFLYPAVLLAVEHVNSDSRVLHFPEYKLNDYNITDTEVCLVETETRRDAAYSVYTYLQNTEVPIHGIIGPDQSDITERIGFISGQEYQHLISYGATDPMLANRDRYPLVFRTVPSQNMLNVGRLGVLQMFQWYRIGVFPSTELEYAKAAESFVGLMSKDYPTLKITYIASFSKSPAFGFDQLHSAKIKIVLAMFSEKLARRVLCQACRYKDGTGSLTDYSHVWILPSYYDPSWWKLSEEDFETLPSDEKCSNEEMEDILTSVLFVGSLNYHFGSRYPEQGTSLDVSLGNFLNQLLIKTRQVFPPLQNLTDQELSSYLLHSNGAAAYDATWSMALAWNNSLLRLLLEDDICSQLNKTKIAHLTQAALNQSLSNLRLHGLSGYHQFNTSPDAFGRVLVSQFQSGARVPVGIFEVVGGEELSERESIIKLGDFVYLRDNQNFSEEPWKFGPVIPTERFYWKGPDGRVPSDGAIVVYSNISYAAMGCLIGAFLVSLAFGTSLIIANIVWRKNRHIKASSPKLNIVIIVGCMLVMPCPLLIGLSFSVVDYGIPHRVADAICLIDLILRNTGYTIAVATLVLKNYRIYRIFHNPNMQIDNLKLSSNRLILMVVLLQLPLVVPLVVSMVIDMQHLRYSVYETSPTELLHVTHCHSKYLSLWRSLCLGYILFLLLALGLLSMHNSKLPTRFVEEGNSGNRAVLIMILLLFFFIITLALVDHNLVAYYLTFWLSSCWFLVLPDLLLLSLFIPKFILMYKENKAKRKRRLEATQSFQLVTRYTALTRRSTDLRIELAMKDERLQTLRTQMSNASMAEGAVPLSPPCPSLKLTE